MFELVKEISRRTPVPMVRGDGARVLQLSMRRIADLVASCTIYEFEEMVATLVPADRIEPQDLAAQDFLRKVYKLGRMVTGSPSLARKLTPRGPRVRLSRDYDLFLPVFNHAHELFALDFVPEWRERCRWAACFISEVWEGQIPEYLVERLSQFDHVYLGVAQPVEAIARITGRPCSYLPLGVDALLFAPEPDAARPIDVCGIGRRSEVTHRALLEMARRQHLFYYFDTARARGVTNAARQITFSVVDPAQHRFLYATLLKNSRYFMASRARANEPEVTGGRQEISARFFEGAAAGTVMIGDPPRNALFGSYFDWPDAVIEVPYDSPDIADVIESLDADPERVARIRRDAVVGTLRKNDWAYRLQTVVRAADILPTQAMTERIKKLRALADGIAGRAPAAPARARGEARTASRERTP